MRSVHWILATPSEWSEDVWVGDCTPVERGRSRETDERAPILDLLAAECERVTGHRVGRRDLQGTAGPRAAPRALTRRCHSPRRATHPHADRRDPAQQRHRTNPLALAVCGVQAGRDGLAGRGEMVVRAGGCGRCQRCASCRRSAWSLAVVSVGLGTGSGGRRRACSAGRGQGRRPVAGCCAGHRAPSASALEPRPRSPADDNVVLRFGRTPPAHAASPSVAGDQDEPADRFVLKTWFNQAAALRSGNVRRPHSRPPDRESSCVPAGGGSRCWRARRGRTRPVCGRSS